MQSFVKPLEELAELEIIRKTKMEKQGVMHISGCVGSQKTHFMYALSDGCSRKIIAVSSESKAKAIYEEYRLLEEAVYLYPAKDLLFYQADLRGKELIRRRMEVLQAIIESKEVTVITSFDGFMDALLPM
ncbi:MAG: transcription-repair coupling factor, partial [Lachnospiraceae bacterium]